MRNFLTSRAHEGLIHEVRQTLMTCCIRLHVETTEEVLVLQVVEFIAAVNVYPCTLKFISETFSRFSK
jgi:hypothetical protein